MLSGYTPIFTPWADRPYEADAVRSAVDAIARNAAKLRAKHIRRVGDTVEHVGGNIEKVLAVRPNPNMNAYDFLYKMVTTLLIDNNAFAYPVWEGTTLVAIWPINCVMAEFVEDASQTIYVKFYFADGGNVVLPYSEVIHLRRHFYDNDLLGDIKKPINSVLSAIHTANEGIAQAIKTSAYLRGIIRYQGMLKEEDIKANRDRFVQEYLTVQNTGGIAALDGKVAEYIPLNNEPKIINAAQMKELRDAVYRYFGVNENIVMGNYDEDEWNAFYESTIEPIAIQMSLEFTSKLFTERELGFGNEIIFESNRLQYASNNTKTNMISTLMPLGVLTINEAREILNLPPVEDGDKRLVSLNYVNAQLQDVYQLGEEQNQGGEE
jgi:HK97 family phage portal protein